MQRRACVRVGFQLVFAVGLLGVPAGVATSAKRNVFHRCGRVPAKIFSRARFLATECTDQSLLPWRPGAAVAERRRELEHAVAQLPRSAIGGFPRAAARIRPTNCLEWPADPQQPPTGMLPDVPVLVVVGDLDIRTPVAGARSTARRFRHAQLVIAPGWGHVVLGRNHGSKLCRAVIDAWAKERRTPATCSRDNDFATPLPSGSSSLAALPPSGPGGKIGRELTAVVRTILDARTALHVVGADAQGLTVVAGLEAGRAAYDGTRLHLHGYSLVPGVSVSGNLTWHDLIRRTPPLSGGLRVVGHDGIRGSLRVDDRRRAFIGTLGGKRVRVPITL